jgi:hypothetical protein
LTGKYQLKIGQSFGEASGSEVSDLELPDDLEFGAPRVAIPSSTTPTWVHHHVVKNPVASTDDQRTYLADELYAKIRTSLFQYFPAFFTAYEKLKNTRGNTEKLFEAFAKKIANYCRAGIELGWTDFLHGITKQGSRFNVNIPPVTAEQIEQFKRVNTSSIELEKEFITNVQQVAAFEEEFIVKNIHKLMENEQYMNRDAGFIEQRNKIQNQIFQIFQHFDWVNRGQPPLQPPPSSNPPFPYSESSLSYQLSSHQFPYQLSSHPFPYQQSPRVPSSQFPSSQFQSPVPVKPEFSRPRQFDPQLLKDVIKQWNADFHPIFTRTAKFVTINRMKKLQDMVPNLNENEFKQMMAAATKNCTIDVNERADDIDARALSYRIQSDYFDFTIDYIPSQQESLTNQMFGCFIARQFGYFRFSEYQSILDPLMSLRPENVRSVINLVRDRDLPLWLVNIAHSYLKFAQEQGVKPKTETSGVRTNIKSETSEAAVKPEHRARSLSRTRIRNRVELRATENDDDLYFNPKRPRFDVTAVPLNFEGVDNESGLLQTDRIQDVASDGEKFDAELDLTTNRAAAPPYQSNVSTSLAQQSYPSQQQIIQQPIQYPVQQRSQPPQQQRSQVPQQQQRSQVPQQQQRSQVPQQQQRSQVPQQQPIQYSSQQQPIQHSSQQQPIQYSQQQPIQYSSQQSPYISPSAPHQSRKSQQQQVQQPLSQQYPSQIQQPIVQTQQQRLAASVISIQPPSFPRQVQQRVPQARTLQYTQPILAQQQPIAAVQYAPSYPSQYAVQGQLLSPPPPLEQQVFEQQQPGPLYGEPHQVQPLQSYIDSAAAPDAEMVDGSGNYV